MQVSKISFNNQNFKGVKQNNKKTKDRNYALGALTYATMVAIYPHDYEKIINRLNPDFESLPVRGKIINAAKVIFPFLAYPMFALAGLKIIVDLIRKYETKNKN